MDSSELLKKRFIELARRAYSSGTYRFTDFLSLSEQSDFSEIKKEISGIPYTAFGGAPGCERVIIRFGDEESFGYTEDFPIVTLKAEPKSEKFADRLTHRDFLGALMNLGIERSTLGDIPIINNTAYIFAKEDIAPYIISSLTRVRHTDLAVSVCDTLPEGELYRTERKRIQISGERCDSVIAKTFSISREEASGLFSKRLVFLDGRLTESPSRSPKPGEIISVRGYGRIKYVGVSGLSKKGKLNVDVDVFL